MTTKKQSADEDHICNRCGYAKHDDQTCSEHLAYLRNEDIHDPQSNKAPEDALLPGQIKPSEDDASIIPASSEAALRIKLWGDLPNWSHPPEPCTARSPCELCRHSIDLIMQAVAEYCGERERKARVDAAKQYEKAMTAKFDELCVKVRSDPDFGNSSKGKKDNFLDGAEIMFTEAQYQRRQQEKR